MVDFTCVFKFMTVTCNVTCLYFYHDVKAQTVQTVLTQSVYKLQSF